MTQEGETSNKSECHHRRRGGRVWMRLRNASVFSIVIHSCAALVMLFALREGLDTNTDFAARMRFLVDRRSEWTLAWMVWNAAAFSILYFYFCFVRAHHRWSESLSDEKPPQQSYARISAMHFALALSTAAVALDLGAESIQMGVLPDIAATYLQQDVQLPAAAAVKALFEAINRTSIMLTGCMANFLYTATATVLIIATRKRYGLITLISGALVSISGTWLSVACILNSVSNMFWTNAVLLPALVIWQLAIALDAQKRGREAATTETPAD